jgi:hypothetical protein
MKNRFLPLSLTTVFLGLSLLFFSVLTVTGQTGNPSFRKFNGSWLERYRVNQHTGLVNQQDVVKAQQQASALREKSSGSMDLNWLSMGPDNYPGLVWSAIFDNTDPSGLTIIAGSEAGGIWKSIDLGLTWVSMPVENNLVLNVSSLIQTSNGAIYAATGVTSCHSVKINGSGIYRASGGGAFTAIAGTQNNPDFAGVAKLTVAPQSGRLYAATTGGLYYSDNGDLWIKAKSGYAMDVCVGSDGTVITAIDDAAYMAAGGDLNAWVTLTTGAPALPNQGIGWMVFAIAPSDGNVIYASLADTTGKLLDIYCSTDKGVNWSVVFPNNHTYEPFSGGNGCYSNTIAVFPNDPYKLYLGGVNMWYGRQVQPGFYNWEKVSFGSFGSLSPLFAPAYHHSYVFRPNNAGQFVMATDGGVTIATIGADGVTFQTSNKNLQSSQFNSLAFSAQKTFVMGGGDRIGTLALGYFYPSQVSFPSTGYQVWRVNETAYSANYQPQPSDSCGTGGTCVWSNIDSRVAVYTKVGNPEIRRQDFTDINYTNFFSNNIKTDVSGDVPMRLWESFDQGSVFGITRDSAKFIADLKTIPADTTILVQSGSNRVLFPYLTTAPIPKGDTIMVADPLATRFFIYGDSVHNGVHFKGIYMTKDMLKLNRTPEYYLMFKDVAANDPVTALAVSTDLNTVWAGTTKGRLIRITGIINAYDSATANIASSQCVLVNSEFTNTPVTGRMVCSISINPTNSNLVMVTLGNYGNTDYVYYSKNGNAPVPVFTSIQTNLPKAPVYCGLLEMSNPDNVILGTDMGVYSTTNLSSGAPLWSPDMQNIDDVAVTDIRQQVINDYRVVNRGIIYLASYGRGLWMETSHAVVGIDPVIGELRTNGTLKLNPNPVKDILNVSYTNENSGSLGLSVFDLTGRLVINSSFGEQPKGVFNASINLSGLSQGVYIVNVGNGYGKIVKR